jgi:hypothetical protein
MKKSSTPKARRVSKSSDMLPEYQFDYRKARPNRFAEQAGELPLVVVLEPDLAKVFTSSEAVNKVLRALVSAMPRAQETH